MPILKFTRTAAVLVVIAGAGAAYNIHTAGPTDIRYGGPPARDANGKILRDHKVLDDFAKIHPCPSTGEQSRVCPGWALDHVVPLACNGKDVIYNLQWLPDGIKNGPVTEGITTSTGRVADIHPKDRWERRVYADLQDPSPEKSCALQLPYPSPSH